VNPRTQIIEPGLADYHYWRGLWRYCELLYPLAWRIIAVRYQQTLIGLASGLNS
jgi:lipopolysaccharide transport system permease protein